MDFDLIQRASLIHKAFEDLKALLDDDRGVDPLVSGVYAKEASDSPSMDLDSMQGLEGGESETMDLGEEFPGRTFFKPSQINPEDPAFASGVSLGIPYAVAVRCNDGQNKLIPIMGGEFRGYGRI